MVLDGRPSVIGPGAALSTTAAGVGGGAHAPRGSARRASPGPTTAFVEANLESGRTAESLVTSGAAVHAAGGPLASASAGAVSGRRAKKLARGAHAQSISTAPSSSVPIPITIGIWMPSTGVE
jgi:hypothetical protein